MIFFLNEDEDIDLRILRDLKSKNKTTFPKIPINHVYENPIKDIFALELTD